MKALKTEFAEILAAGRKVNVYKSKSVMYKSRVKTGPVRGARGSPNVA